MKKPAFEFRLLPQKSLRVVSLIFQCGEASQEAQEVSGLDLRAGWSYKYYLQLDADMMGQVEQSAGDVENGSKDTWNVENGSKDAWNAGNGPKG